MRVLITGASGGIGAACVRRFLDEGHEVVGFDLLPAAVEHERYRHLIVDVRELDAFPYQETVLMAAESEAPYGK